MMEDVTLNRLRKLIIQQKTASLPEPNNDPATQVAYESVNHYDQYVSQVVIAVLQGQDKLEGYLEKEKLHQILTNLSHSTFPASLRLAILYQRYTDRLEEMFTLASKIVSDRIQKR